MKVRSKELLAELRTSTQLVLQGLDKLRDCNPEYLRKRAAENSWNALECLEHLIRYGDFYNKAFNTALEKHHAAAVDEFRPGWLGNYFAEMMKPVPAMTSMKTFNSKNPLRQEIDDEVLDRFEEQQREILEILERAKGVNLNRIRVSTTLGSLVKFKLGDALRFVIYHNQRHMHQALKAAGVMDRVTV